jgi:L-asparagine permease
VSEQSVRDIARSATHDVGDDGYHKSLKARHINMIAIGGAIGTGLFLGGGGRLVEAGPSLAIAYAVCGIFAFFVVRALETANPEKIMPRAINSIMWRIGIFYVGSVVLLAMLMPWSAYSADESPFVTVLANIGVPAAADVMNLVVLTAAMSSLNSGLYSTGRILRSMSMAHSAPRFTAVMNRNGVPYGGILLTAAVCVVGVGLNYLVPEDAFEIVLNFASIGILATWGIIVLSHLLFVRRTQRGELDRPTFRLPFSPWTQIATLAFLASVVILMAFDDTGRIVLAGLPVIVLALVIGWFGVRKRIDTSVLEKINQ